MRLKHLTALVAGLVAAASTADAQRVFQTSENVPVTADVVSRDNLRIDITAGSFVFGQIVIPDDTEATCNYAIYPPFDAAGVLDVVRADITPDDPLGVCEVIDQPTFSEATVTCPIEEAIDLEYAATTSVGAQSAGIRLWAVSSSIVPIVGLRAYSRRTAFEESIGCQAEARTLNFGAAIEVPGTAEDYNGDIGAIVISAAYE